MAPSDGSTAVDRKATPLDDLSDQLECVEIGDGRQYYKDLCLTLLVEARTFEVRNEMKVGGTTFVEKVFRKVDHLDTTATRYYAFHAWIRVATTILHPEQYAIAGQAQKIATEAIFKILQRIKDCLERDAAERRQSANSASHYPALVLWDFVAANRKLWTAWKQRCSSHSKYCWHRTNRQLIEYIYKRAYGEIRAKVMLTIGTKLPTELAEKIFEFAMAAEQIPLDASIVEDEARFVKDKVRPWRGGGTMQIFKKVRGSEYCHHHEDLLKDAGY